MKGKRLLRQNGAGGQLSRRMKFPNCLRKEFGVQRIVTLKKQSEKRNLKKGKTS